MEKAVMQAVITKLKSVGVDSFGLFCRGGNIEMRNNNKDCFLILQNDFVMSIKPTNGAYAYGDIDIDFVPYDNIDYIFPLDLSWREAFDIIKAYGTISPDLKKFLLNFTTRMDVNNNSRTGQEGDIRDRKGNPVTALSGGRVGYVVQ